MHLVTSSDALATSSLGLGDHGVLQKVGDASRPWVLLLSSEAAPVKCFFVNNTKYVCNIDRLDSYIVT